MKKIIFFLVYLTVNSYSDSNYDIDSACCSQYGQRTNGSSGIIEKVTLYSGNVTGSSANGSTIYDVADTFRLTYDDDRTCLSAGLVSLNDVQTEFTDPDGTWVHLGDGVYTRSDAHVYTRKVLYICECDKVSNPDIPKTDPDPTWYLVGSVNCLGDSSGETTDLMITSKTDCCEQIDYYKVKETCLDGGIWSELSDGSWDCVAPPCEGDECNDGGDVSGRCDAPSIELPAMDEFSCNIQNATDIVWNGENDVGYCCGVPIGPTCPVDYIKLDNSDGSNPTSEECTSMGTELSSSYENVYLEYTSDSLCCVKWDTPSSDSNDSSTDDNSTTPPDDGSGDSTDDNSTTPPDDNPTDSNSTSTDVSGIEDRLDKINADNNSNANRNHDDLDKLNKDNNSNSNALKDTVAGASNIAHEDAEDIKDILEGIRGDNHHFYRDIKAIIGNNTMESPTTDTNSSDDADSSDENSTDEYGIDLGYLDGLVEFKDLISNSFYNADTMFNDIKAILNGDIPYSFDDGGSCIYHFTFGTFTKDVNLCKFGAYLRPFVTFILTLSMLYSLIAFNLWFYFKVFGTKV